MFFFGFEETKFAVPSVIEGRSGSVPEDSQVFDYSVALGLVYHLEKPRQFIKLLGKKTEKMFLLESRYDEVLGKMWIEEKNGWQISREWLEEEVKKTGISEIFTATRGGKDLPASGFRLLIAGKL